MENEKKKKIESDGRLAFELTRHELEDLLRPLESVFKQGERINPEVFETYYKVLKRFDYSILERSIEIIIEEKADQRFFPKPAEIIEMTHGAFKTREAGDADFLKYLDGKDECPKCQDTGYVQKLVMHPKLHSSPYKTVTECTCERGQRITANWKLHIRRKKRRY